MRTFLPGLSRGDAATRALADGALRRGEGQDRLPAGGGKDYAVFLLDPQGRVLGWGPGAERLKGYRAEEIIGHHFSCFYLPEDIAQRKPELALHAALAQGQFEEEAWRVRKDGSRFWAHVLITALYGDTGHQGPRA